MHQEKSNKQDITEKEKEELYHKIREALGRVTFHRPLSERAEWEIIIVVYDKILRRLQSGRRGKIENMEAYALTVVSREVKKYRKGGKGSEILVESTHPVFEMATGQYHPSGDGREFVMDAQAAMAELPQAQRMAFLLTRIEGRTLAEAAEILGTSKKVVAVNRDKATEYIKSKICSDGL